MAVQFSDVGFEEMPIDERLTWINNIWATLPGSAPLSPEQSAELDRRLDALDRGEGESKPVEEVLTRLRAKLSS